MYQKQVAAQVNTPDFLLFRNSLLPPVEIKEYNGNHKPVLKSVVYFSNQNVESERSNSVSNALDESAEHLSFSKRMASLGIQN